jgi:hypothetical protein
MWKSDSESEFIVNPEAPPRTPDGHKLTHGRAGMISPSRCLEMDNLNSLNNLPSVKEEHSPPLCGILLAQQSTWALVRTVASHIVIHSTNSERMVILKYIGFWFVLHPSVHEL